MWVSRQFFRFSLVMSWVAMSSMASTPAWSKSLKEIKQRGELTVAVKDNLRPLGFRGADGNLQGLEIDIAKRLAEEILGNPDAVVLQPVQNVDRLNVVLEGKVDLAIARVTATDSRSRLVDFSPYYYLDGTGFVTKDTSISRLSDLSTKTIALLNGSSTIAVVKHALPAAKFVGVDSYQEALALLEKGEADAFAADNSVLTGWIQDYPEYRMLPVRLSGEALCIVMPRGLQYSDLRLRVNQAIVRWKAEGWLTERITAWGLPQ